jgi:hypothetical protein
LKLLGCIGCVGWPASFCFVQNEFISHEIWGFPVIFPSNQSIEIYKRTTCQFQNLTLQARPSALLLQARYGEVTYGGMERLYEALELKKEDVFYDLGCGVGKRPAAIFWDDGMVDLWGFNGD